ncbi:MAG: hypothetical protein ACE5FH_02955 [Candidatus Zixiibacteriota bacterium]
MSKFVPLSFFWLALLAVVFGGRFYSTDVVAQCEVAGSFLGERPFLTASGEYGFIVEGTRKGAFIPHGVGYSVLLVPAALVGHVIGEEALKVTGASLNGLWSLVLVLAWYAVICMKYRGVSLLRMIVLAVGGMTLMYGRIPFDVTSAAASAMLGLYLLEKNRFVPAGLCLGLSIFIRLDSILLLPVFWRDWKSTLAMLRGTIPFLLLIATANWYRFGSPFIDGHNQDPAMFLTAFKGGIPGLLLSPGKGLIYYSPLAFLAIFYQRDWRYWLPFVLALILHGMLHDWSGGTGWGPRFLFTTLPFFLIPLARKGAGGKMFWVIGAIGVVITFVASWSNTSLIEQGLGASVFSDPTRQKVIWTYASSPLVGAFRNFGQGVPDLLCVTAAQSVRLPVWAGIMAQFASAGCIAAAGFVLLNRDSRLSSKS